MELATVPAKNEDVVYWLTRLMAHFPRRDSRQDGIITADLSADMVASNVSVVALVSVCSQIRREATKEGPWLPPSGEILRRAIRETSNYHRYINKIKNPQIVEIKINEHRTNRSVLPEKPWHGKKFNELDDSVKIQFIEFVASLPSSMAKAYCDSMGVDYETIEFSEVDQRARSE